MKHRNWLNLTEYLLLIGSGVGSVATAASQQILFTAAPISALLLLNLVNRRRLETEFQETLTTSVAQLDQKLADEIGSLQKQMQALPNFLDLASLRKAVLHTSQETLTEFSNEIAQIKQDLDKPDWRTMQRSLRQLQQQYASVSESVANVTQQLSRLNTPNKLDRLDNAVTQLKTDVGQLRVQLETVSQDQAANQSRVLQDQINHLNRRLNHLPTPFDATSLKQDINSLVKVVGELASRRELSHLSAQVEKLSQQNQTIEQSVMPLKLATTILHKQLETLAAKLSEGANSPPPSPSQDELETLKRTIADLEQRLSQLPSSTDLANWRSDVQGLVSTHMGPLQQQLSTVQQVTTTLEQQQRDLRDWVHHLPQILDSSALQAQLKSLVTRVEWTENSRLDAQAQIEAAVRDRLSEVVPLQASPQYELVFDVRSRQQSATGSRTMLEQALQQAEGRVVLVHPYPTLETLSPEVIRQMQHFLDREGCLDLGWGHLGDASRDRVPRSLNNRRILDSTQKGFLYDTLNQLTQFKRQYPDQFRFKILGTDEQFVVCDRSYAILGAQSLPTASVLFPEAAVGLRTTDPDVIQELVDRFDDPVLDADDATAYFHRAVTRYDLGDYPGAISDYTSVLRILPSDDVAYNNRGLARYDTGDRRGAIDDFGRAVQYNPNGFIAYCNRGMVRAELGDKLGAIEDCTLAIQLNPDYVTAYFCRGVARTRLQNKLGAIQDYTEVIRLSPDDATAYFYRGLALIKIGRRIEAMHDLQHAAHLFSERGDSTNYRQAMQAMKKLQETILSSESVPPLVPNGI